MTESFRESFSGDNVVRYFDIGHRYELNGEFARGVSSIKDQGMPMPQALLNWKINNKGKKATKEQEIGTFTHKYAELTVKGKKNEFDMAKVEAHPGRAEIVNCMGLFDEYHKGRSGTVLDTEVLVASPTYQFAGTVDAMVRDQEGLGIEDYKTSKGFFPEHFFQTAGGYRTAAEEWFGEPVKWCQINLFKKTAAEFSTLRLNSTGWYLNGKLVIEDIHSFREFKEQFIRAVETCNYNSAMESIFKRFV